MSFASATSTIKTAGHEPTHFSCLYGAVQAMTSEKFTGRRIMAEKKVWPSMTSVHVGLASWLPVSAIEASGPNLWDQAGAGWAGTLGGNGDAFI